MNILWFGSWRWHVANRELGSIGGALYLGNLTAEKLAGAVGFRWGLQAMSARAGLRKRAVDVQGHAHPSLAAIFVLFALLYVVTCGAAGFYPKKLRPAKQLMFPLAFDLPPLVCLLLASRRCLVSGIVAGWRPRWEGGCGSFATCSKPGMVGSVSRSRSDKHLVSCPVHNLSYRSLPHTRPCLVLFTRLIRGTHPTNRLQREVRAGLPP